MSWALRDVYPRPETMEGMKRERLEKGAEWRKYSFTVRFQPDYASLQWSSGLALPSSEHTSATPSKSLLYLPMSWLCRRLSSHKTSFCPQPIPFLRHSTTSPTQDSPGKLAGPRPREDRMGFPPGWIAIAMQLSLLPRSCVRRHKRCYHRKPQLGRHTQERLRCEVSTPRVCTKMWGRRQSRGRALVMGRN